MLPMPGMYAGASAIREWQMLASQIKEIAQSLIDATEGRATRVYMANHLEELIAGTADGQIVGDSTLTKEQAQQLQILVGAFRAFIATPIEQAGGLTPADLLSLR